MSTTRLDRILSSCLDHAEKAPTFVQRFAWTMLARNAAEAADRVDARGERVHTVANGLAAVYTVMHAYRARGESAAPAAPQSVN